MQVNFFDDEIFAIRVSRLNIVIAIIREIFISRRDRNNRPIFFIPKIKITIIDDRSIFCMCTTSEIRLFASTTQRKKCIL